MPLSRPTLAELRDRAAAAIQASLPGTDALLRRSNLNIMARLLAGAEHGLYGAMEFLSRQIIPDTAEADYLERWSSVWGVTRLAAVKAVGNVTFTGTNGAQIPAGTTLVRSDGAEFTTDALGIIAAGTATVAVTAVLAGAAGNSDVGAALALSAPLALINSSATVAAGGLVNGADQESDDALRQRLVDRIQQIPHSGAANDYIAWAKEVAGVTRAWCYPLELGAGTVVVRFMRDNDAGGAIPDAGEVAAVQSYIDARRPVAAAVTVGAPVAVPLNFTFTLIAPNTAAVKAAVEAELKDLINREAEPGGTLRLSHIREAISLAAGEDNYTLTAPNADVVSATGSITTFGAIAWP